MTNPLLAALRNTWECGLEHSVTAVFFGFAVMVGEAAIELGSLISLGTMESRNGKGQGEMCNYWR